jgi:hypothetical protein
LKVSSQRDPGADLLKSAAEEEELGATIYFAAGADAINDRPLTSPSIHSREPVLAVGVDEGPDEAYHADRFGGLETATASEPVAEHAGRSIEADPLRPRKDAKAAGERAGCSRKPEPVGDALDLPVGAKGQDIGDEALCVLPQLMLGSFEIGLEPVQKGADGLRVSISPPQW